MVGGARRRERPAGRPWRRRQGTVHADPGPWYRHISAIANVNDGGEDAPLTPRDGFVLLLVVGVLAVGALTAVVASLV